jgi:hypothetical protein
LVEDAEIGLETNLPQPLFIKRGDLFFLLDKGGGPQSGGGFEKN